MKTIIRGLTLVVFVLTIIGCEHTLAPEKEFYFFGDLNRVSWRGDSDAVLRVDGRLVIWGFHDYRPGTFDDIVVKIEFHNVGSYTIEPEYAFLRHTSGYDMGCGIGVSFGSRYDRLVITKYDEQERIIEGTCRFVFKGTNGNPDMRFENGRFRAKVR